MVNPTLKYGDDIIETSDTIIIHSAPETVSCELYNAGPPLPVPLELVIGTEDTGVVSVATDPEKSDVTCKWSYFEPLETDINNLTEIVRRLQLLHDQMEYYFLENVLSKTFTFQFCKKNSEILNKIVRILHSPRKCVCFRSACTAV